MKTKEEYGVIETCYNYIYLTFIVLASGSIFFLKDKYYWLKHYKCTSCNKYGRTKQDLCKDCQTIKDIIE
jgi:hypothetical protein